MATLSRDDFIRAIDIGYPVRALHIYNGGVALVMRVSGHTENSTRGNRKAIMRLTKKSRTKLAFTALATPLDFHSMITLTYGKSWPLDGKTVKHQLNLFCRRLRRTYSAEYIWVIEFQVRGAPHFHLITDVDHINHSDRLWLADTWIEALGYGKHPIRNSGLSSSDIEQATKIHKVHSHARSWEQVRKEDGGKRYLVKYATKTYQKIVPARYRDVGRFWGASSGVTSDIKPAREILLDETTLRDTLESIGNGAYRCDILPKVIYNV